MSRRILYSAVLLCLSAGSSSPSIATSHDESHPLSKHVFRTEASSTFHAVARGVSVNLTFLDGTRMEGFDGQDFVQLAQVLHACTHAHV